MYTSQCDCFIRVFIIRAVTILLEYFVYIVNVTVLLEYTVNLIALLEL